MQLAIADLFDVSQPTVCQVMHRVSEAIASLLPDFIHLPVNREECKKRATIIPIQSPDASPVVLRRKHDGLPMDNLEVYRFAVDYRKLSSIAKYPRYPLSLIDDLITIIPHTTIKLTLDLK
ncbi:hypothetical protein TNCV_3375191 [Trichonephila clavipes]|nr:hypothetical protein TNCV_3375191 [Trichonephila clavipes]